MLKTEVANLSIRFEKTVLDKTYDSLVMYRTSFEANCQRVSLPCLVDVLVIDVYCYRKVGCVASNINLWAELQDLELLLRQNTRR